MSVTSRSTRTLVLMRHSKSRCSTGAPDHDRPLSGRGRRDGLAAGDWLAGRGLTPELTLVSSAERTRQTLDRVTTGGAEIGAVEVVADLYASDERTVLELVSGVDDAVHTLMVVGHNPAIEETVRLLARRSGHHAWWSAMDEKFPTSAIAVIEFDSDWAKVEPASGALVAYAVPRG